MSTTIPVAGSVSIAAVKKAQENTLTAVYEILKAVEPLKPHSPLALVKTLIPKVRVTDDGRVETLQSDGKTPSVFRVKDLVSEFRATNRFWFQDSETGGQSGSETTKSPAPPTARENTDRLREIFGKDSSSKLANDIARENPGEYRRLRMLAVEAGLI